MDNGEHGLFTPWTAEGILTLAGVKLNKGDNAGI